MKTVAIAQNAGWKVPEDLPVIRAIQAETLAWAISVAKEYVDDGLKNQYPAQAIMRRLEERRKGLI